MRKALDRALSHTTRPPVRLNVCYNAVIVLPEEGLCTPSHSRKPNGIWNAC
jgi:hypothetical protein